MSRRPLSNGVRAGVVGAVLVSSVLAAAPAIALTRDDGDDPGQGMSKLEVLAVFVGIPVASFVAIWILVSIPSMIRGPRYRPGKDWEATPEWYGAPGTEQPEVEGGYGDPALTARSMTSQGADAALTGTIVEPADGGADSGGGGTSARW